MNEPVKGDCARFVWVGRRGQRLRGKLTSIMSDFCRGTPVDHVRMKTPLVERGQRIRRRRRILLYKFCVIALEWSVPHSFTELAQSCISCIYLIIPEICRKAVAVQYGPPFRNLIEGVPHSFPPSRHPPSLFHRFKTSWLSSAYRWRSVSSWI